MNELEQKNRAFIAVYDPDLARSWARLQVRALTPEPARKGGQTVAINGSYVHSRYDPAKEAAKACEGDTKPVHLHLGLGLGHFLAADPVATGERVVVFEPIAALFQTAASHIDFSELLPAKNARVALDEEHLNLILREMGLRRPDQLKIIWSPFHQKQVAQMATWLPQFLAELFRDVTISRKTLAKLMPTFTRSTLHSLPYSYDKPPIDRLAGCFAGMAAVVVAPGPSLERNLIALRPYREHCLVFAVARTMRLLERYGIEPDFLVHNEAQDFYSAIHGCRNFVRTVFLLADQAHHKFYRAAATETFVFFNPTNLVWQWLEQKGLTQPRQFLETGGSVANEAFSAALLLGCRAVALLGQDLAVGKTFYADAEINRRFEHGKEDEAWVAGYYGGQVKTMANYYHFLKWYQNRLNRLRREACPTTLVNATEGGAHLKGFQHQPLHHFLATYATQPRQDVAARCSAAATNHRPPSRQAMAAALLGALAQVEVVRDLCAQYAPFQQQISNLLQQPTAEGLQQLNAYVQTLDQFSRATGEVVQARLPLLNGFIQKELQENIRETEPEETAAGPEEELRALLAGLKDDVTHLTTTYGHIAAGCDRLEPELQWLTRRFSQT